MTLLQIPLRSEFDRFDFSIDLSGLTYKFAFTWNARMEIWVFDLTDNVNNEILSGVPFVLSVNFFANANNTNVPPGFLFALDTSNSDIDAGKSDLGDRVILLYEDLLQ